MIARTVIPAEAGMTLLRAFAPLRETKQYFKRRREGAKEGKKFSAIPAFAGMTGFGRG
ncbi:MAG: hypothetical protein H0X36_10070 [Sphingomonadaceae bacterium]|nr:hypothetical protein [Sphingomonadaceae bacterium]